MRVLILEDHPISGEGLRASLAAAGLEVIGVAATVDIAVSLAVARRPDIVVADLMLGDMPAGLGLPAMLREQDIHAPVVFLSSFDAPYLISEAVRVGASGYLRKATAVKQIIAAIRAVAAGDAVFPALSLRDAVADRAPSPRERQVIELVSLGAGNGEIAARLDISEKTVESHLSRIYSRYRVTSRTELAMLATRQGWTLISVLPAAKAGRDG